MECCWLSTYDYFLTFPLVLIRGIAFIMGFVDAPTFDAAPPVRVGTGGLLLKFGIIGILGLKREGVRSGGLLLPIVPRKDVRGGTIGILGLNEGALLEGMLLLGFGLRFNLISRHLSTSFTTKSNTICSFRSRRLHCPTFFKARNCLQT
jgi:hypothetical protein